MPDHISGMAKDRWNWTMVKPSPEDEANISEMTIRISPRDRDWRTPAMICGLAEGSTRYRRRAQPSMP